MNTVARSAAKRSVPGRAASRSPIAESAAPPSAHDQLVAIKRSLEAVSLALNAVDPNTLSDRDHTRWAAEVNEVDLAIARVRNSLLNGITVAFEAEIPALQAGTAQLEADLAQLARAVDIINAVSAALGVLEQIVTLGR